MISMELRRYQRDACNSVVKAWRHVDRTLLVMATGTGKTIVMANLAKWCVQNGARVLILAHRSELLDQARDKLLKAVSLPTGLEKAVETTLNSNVSVVVGSVQTLARRKRLEKFPQDHFDYIYVDEAHHLTANTYQRVLDHFCDAKVLGVTATPDRGDRVKLVDYFDSVAFTYDIKQAISDGFLVPIKAQTVKLNIDLTNVGSQAGDYKAGDLGDALTPYLEQIADEMLNLCKNRKTIVFLPLISTSQKMRDILNNKGFRAAEVNGKSEDREQIAQDFKNGKYNVVCNAMIWTEGFDCPSVDCVIMLRPTKIRSLYVQAIGRGTRLSEGKDSLLVLDFLFHTRRHDLMTPANIFVKDAIMAKRIKEMIDLSDSAVDIADAERDAIKECEEKLANELAEVQRKLISAEKQEEQQKYILFNHKILEKNMRIEDARLIEPQLKEKTLWQQETLRSFGFPEKEIETYEVADIAISILSKRRKTKKATYKQMRLLTKNGITDIDITFDEAVSYIDQISQNGWKLPQHLYYLKKK